MPALLASLAMGWGKKQQFKSALLPFSLGLLACTATPPVQEMSDARQALVAAESAHADERASQSFGEAVSLLNDAEEKLRAREYDKARQQAIASRNKALEAQRLSELELDDSRF